MSVGISGPDSGANNSDEFTAMTEAQARNTSGQDLSLPEQAAIALSDPQAANSIGILSARGDYNDGYAPALDPSQGIINPQLGSGTRLAGGNRLSDDRPTMLGNSGGSGDGSGVTISEPSVAYAPSPVAASPAALRRRRNRGLRSTLNNSAFLMRPVA